MKRDKNLEVLKDKDKIWDIAVIGGGASGLGVALDALSRGLTVALFEKADFAKGTSSRSTKLVHGGVRYLAQGDIFLVWEALKERGRILQNAPHLTQNQSFIIPIYSWLEKIQYIIGLKIYDWMAGSYRLGKSSYISKKETLSRLPMLNPHGLIGGMTYYDGQFDDARLALNLAQTCDDMGGCVLNYTKVYKLTKDEKGKVTGLIVRDMIKKMNHNIRAKMVVNATGVFADKILSMDQPGAAKSILPSQGIHLVLDIAFLGGLDALMIPKTPDGRVLFAVPWKGKLVMGTTDTIRKKPKMEPEALSSEIDFVLKTASAYLVKKPERSDVLSVFVGMRPLSAPQGGSAKTKEISRSHKIIVSASQLISLIGGKWTTFRKMGQDTVAYFKKVTGESLKPSRSANMRLHGYTESQDAGHLSVYGSDAGYIEKLIQEDNSMGVKLHPEYPFTIAEVVWAVQYEMALKLEYVLSRRIRILILDANAAWEMAPKVAEIMAVELGQDSLWIQSEMQDFRKVYKKHRLKG